MAECEAPTHGEEIEAMIGEATGLFGARRFPEAREVIERVESADPGNAFGAHARIHFHIDEGTLAEGAARGIAFLEAHDPFEGINVHNSMHLASILLDMARAGESVEWQERVVVPVAEGMPMQYPSAAHLLWRTEVAGYGRAAGRALPWEILVRPGATAVDGPDGRPDPLGAVAHGMAWVANGDGARRKALLGALLSEGLADTGRPGAATNGATVAAVIDGLHQWWEGDFEGAARILGGARGGFASLTEYAGQLGPIEDTLIDAEWRCGRRDHSEDILRRRIESAAVPYPRDQACLARLLASDGRLDEAVPLARAAIVAWSSGDAGSAERAEVSALVRA